MQTPKSNRVSRLVIIPCQIIAGYFAFSWFVAIAGVSFAFIGLIIGLLTAGGVGYAFDSHYEEKDRKLREEISKKEREDAIIRETEKARQKIAREKQWINSNLDRLKVESRNLVRSLPYLIESAEKAIDHAETEFKEGVFATFCDAIESAASYLAEFRNKVDLIEASARQYETQGQKVQATPFPIRMSAIPDVANTTKRLQFVVRQAQKQPDFAKIYEMRRTNQVLIAGFSSLGEALTNISDSIQNSLDSLNSSLSTQLSELSSQQARMADGMQNAITTITDEHEKDRAQFQARADEMREHETEVRKRRK